MDRIQFQDLSFLIDIGIAAMQPTDSPMDLNLLRTPYSYMGQSPEPRAQSSYGSTETDLKPISQAICKYYMEHNNVW